MIVRKQGYADTADKKGLENEEEYMKKDQFTNLVW